jgi:hypothetical protein
MGFISQKKAGWYLRKHLVDIISENPKVIQLKFKPFGLGQATGDPNPFYYQYRLNQCVVCGNADKNRLNRHHVIPKVFWKYFAPRTAKGHRWYDYHDILMVCITCHKTYEKHATRLIESLSKQHNIYIDPQGGWRNDHKRTYAIIAARALLDHIDKIPPKRINCLTKIISDYLERPPEREDMIRLYKGGYRAEKDPSYICGYKLLVEKIGYYNLSRIWRLHFIDTMSPKFIPKYWSIDHDNVKNYR